MKQKIPMKAELSENKQQRLLDYLKKTFSLRFNILTGEIIDLKTV